MGADAAVWLPMVLGGVGGFFGSGSPGEGAVGFPSERFGWDFPTPSSYDPLAMTMAREGIGDMRRLGAKTVQYAAQPVSLPSAVVQPLPMYKGGGAFVDVGAPTMDVAFRFPEVLSRPGVGWGTPENMGTPQEGPSPTPFYYGEGATVHERSRPPGLLPQQLPQFGAGYSGMKQMGDALALAGIPLSEQAPGSERSMQMAMTGKGFQQPTRSSSQLPYYTVETPNRTM